MVKSSDHAEIKRKKRKSKKMKVHEDAKEECLPEMDGDEEMMQLEGSAVADGFAGDF